RPLRRLTPFPYTTLFRSWTGAAIEVPACLALALQYTGSGRLSRRALFWQALMPVITLVVVWTSNFHGLIRHSVHLRTIGSLRFLDRKSTRLNSSHLVISY